jgi:hypothetical protein
MTKNKSKSAVLLSKSAEEAALASTLANIAKIPNDQRAAFCDKARVLISVAYSCAHYEKGLQRIAQQKRFKELEAALLATRRALNGLSERGQALFAREVLLALHGHSRPLTWTDVGQQWVVIRRLIRLMAVAAAKIANKDPNRKSGKGGTQNWVFLGFVLELWRCANKHGGELTAHCKNNIGSGSMFQALRALRPYFAAIPEGYGAGYIKPVLPVQTIANMVNDERKKVHAIGT